MLKLYWIEIILRLIPETLLMILGIYIITKQTFNVTKYILSSIVMGIVTYFVRLLPIYFGVHTIICVILLVSILTLIGIPIIKAIYGTLLMYFMLGVSEFFNLCLLKFLNIDASFSNMGSFKKCVVGFPSLIMFALFTLTIYFLLKLREGKQNDINREFSN